MQQNECNKYGKAHCNLCQYLWERHRWPLGRPIWSKLPYIMNGPTEKLSQYNWMGPAMIMRDYCQWQCVGPEMQPKEIANVIEWTQ
jgi:hypothetical protein